jgi:hypothetical protein
MQTNLISFLGVIHQGLGLSFASEIRHGIRIRRAATLSFSLALPGTYHI